MSTTASPATASPTAATVAAAADALTPAPGAVPTSAPAAPRGFLASVSHAARTVAGKAMQLARAAGAAVARATRWTGAQVAGALAMPPSADRATIGTAAFALVLLIVAFVIAHARGLVAAGAR